MNDMRSSDAERRARLRWVTLGEAIAIAALIVSAAGVWITWKSSAEDKGPTTIVERRQAIPLTLRGKPVNEGRTLEISPIENGHALQSLTVTVARGSAIDIGSDGDLSASDLQSALGEAAAEGKGPHHVRAKIDAKYVEAGADKTATGSYMISYRWEGGGLFGGRSLRMTGITKS
jgi:hypothetical protein